MVSRCELKRSDNLLDTILLRKLPTFEGVMLVIYILGFFAMFIIFWVMGDRAPASEVWFEFEDSQGWGSVSLVPIIDIRALIWPVLRCNRLTLDDRWAWQCW